MPPNRLTSEELQKRAKEELNEDPHRTVDDITALTQWLIKEPHISGRTDDLTLLQFLRNSKFSLEGAKKRIDNFYTIKTMMPEYFCKIDPEDPHLHKLLKLGVFVPLDYDQEGRKIILCKLSILCKEKLTFDDYIRLTHVTMMYVLRDEQTQICGISILADFSDLDTWIINVFSPANVKNILFSIQDCTPIRLRLITAFNTGPIFDIIFGISKIFLKKKILERFRFPGCDLESLYSIIPADCLPSEQGGTIGDVQHYLDKMLNDMMKLREYFLEDDFYGVDESKRIGKRTIDVDRFGMDGSFRKLNVD